MKKILSFALAIALTLNVFSAAASAEENVGGQATTSYADYVKSDTMPQNMITADAGCSDWDAINNKNLSRLSWNFHIDAITGGYNGNTYRFMVDSRYGSEKAYKVNPAGKTLNNMSGDFEKGH